MDFIMRFCFAIAILAGTVRAPLFAQAAPAVWEHPRFYVGVSGMAGNYEATYPKIRSYDEGVFSPSLTLGYQFADRAAIQLSVERSKKLLYIEFFDQVSSGGIARVGYYRENHQHFALPLILRLSGTKRSTRRLQFDALAGFVLLHASYSRVFAKLDEQQQTISYDEQAEQATNVALSLGGSIRYRFGRRIEVFSDANLNRTIGAAATSGFVNVYTLGLRYRFGYR